MKMEASGNRLQANRLEAAGYPTPPFSRFFAKGWGNSVQCIIMVYNDAMATTKQVRRSVTLPGAVAKQVDSIASRRRLSDNRVLVELIELGIEASKQKEKVFFELAERFRAATDTAESKRLGDQLGRFVFGE